MLRPYNQQWQFSVRRELPAQRVFEARYMGMHSPRKIDRCNLNEGPDRTLALGRTENNTLPDPFFSMLPATSTLDRDANMTQSCLCPRFPRYITRTLQEVKTPRALYYGLPMKLDKRFTHGLNSLLGYSVSGGRVTNS